MLCMLLPDKAGFHTKSYGAKLEQKPALAWNLAAVDSSQLRCTAAFFLRFLGFCRSVSFVDRTIGVVNLPEILAAFHREHDQVKISLSHDSVPALLQATADEQLDLCFVDGPIDERRLVQHLLGIDTLHLIVPAKDPLAKRDSISLTDPALSARDFLNYRTDSALSAQIEAACAVAGLARTVVCEVQSIQYLVEGTRQGLGLSILPRSSIDAHQTALVSIPIEPKLTRHLSVATTRRHAPSPVVAAFLGILDTMRLS